MNSNLLRFHCVHPNDALKIIASWLRWINFLFVQHRKKETILHYTCLVGFDYWWTIERNEQRVSIDLGVVHKWRHHFQGVPDRKRSEKQWKIYFECRKTKVIFSPALHMAKFWFTSIASCKFTRNSYSQDAIIVNQTFVMSNAAWILF